jgi:hypothetical protein
VPSVGSSPALHLRGPTFYRPNVSLLYVQYSLMSQAYPGWSLSEQKRMPRREREYWIEMNKWRQMAAAQARA